MITKKLTPAKTQLNGKSVLSLPSTPKSTAFLKAVLKALIKKIHGNSGNFYLYNQKGQLHALNRRKEDSHILILAKYALEVQKNIVVLSSQDPILQELRKILTEEQISRFPDTFVCTPIVLPDKNIGVIYITMSQNTDQFISENHFLLLENIMMHLGLVLYQGLVKKRNSFLFDFSTITFLFLENINSEIEMVTINERLNVLLEVSNLLVSSQNLDSLKKSIMKSAQKVLRVEHSSLFLVDEKTGDLYFDVVAGESEQVLEGVHVPKGQGIVGLCMEKKAAMIINNASQDKRLWRKEEKVQRFSVKNLMAAPLIVDDKGVGVLEVMNTLDRKDFLAQDLDLFQSFSSYVGWAVHRQMLFDNLKDVNKHLTNKLEQLQTMYGMSEILLEKSSNVQDASHKILTWIHKNLKVQNICLWFFYKNSGRIEKIVDLGENLPEEFMIQDWLLEHLFSEQIPYVFKTLPEKSNKVILKNEKIKKNRIGPFILLPIELSEDTDLIGFVYAYSGENRKFGVDDYNLLSSSCLQCAQAISRILLDQKIAGQKAIAKEIEIASRIQQDLLSSTNLKASALVEVTSKCIMAQSVGGDFYEYYIDRKTGNMYFIIADVSGKSITASLFMSVAISVIRAVLRSKHDLKEIMMNINDLLYEQSKIAMFVTVFIACYKPGESTLDYASAGHNGMLLLKQNKSYENLCCKGYPMGVIASSQQNYEVKSIAIDLGDLLVLYTDGITEAESEKGELYGDERLITHLKKEIALSPIEISNSLYENVMQFTPKLSDDFTLLLTRFHFQEIDKNHYRFLLMNEISSIPLLRESIEFICEGKQMNKSIIYDIMLVFDELTTNIVTYALPHEKLFKNYYVCNLKFVEGEVNKIKAYLIDRGKKFKPEKLLEKPNIEDRLSGKRVGGFGLYCSQYLTQKLRFGYRNGFNYVYLEKEY